MRETTQTAGNWALPLPSLLYGPEVETKGDALLAQAETALTELSPDDKAWSRVAVEHKQWQRMKELNAEASAQK